MLKLTRWTIAHRRFVVTAWVVLAVGVLAVSQTIGKRNANNFSLPNTGSQHAIDLLQSHFPAKAGDVDQIVFRDRTGKLGDHSVRAVIVPLLERIARLPHVTGVASPYAEGADAISRDGRIGFASVEFDQRANELPKSAIKRVIASAEAARSPALQVELGGEAIKQVQQPSLGFATGVGLIAAVVVLLLSFGSLLAMGLPILTALFGLGTGLGLIGLASRLIDMVDFSSDLALMIGLGVGIDYALFIVTRYRDTYRDNGGDVQGALELAMNTAGRAILFAGATVVIALLGMTTLGVGYLYGVAIASSLAVLLVLGASLTLLPCPPNAHRQARRAHPPSPLTPARRPRRLLDPLGRAHPAPARLGRARIDGDPADAGRACTRPAPRRERLRHRPPRADDTQGIRPARRRLRQRLQRAPATRRPPSWRRRRNHPHAAHDRPATHARDRLRRRAAAQPCPRHRRDRRLPDHATAERADDEPRQAPPRRRPAAAREGNRNDRSTSAARPRSRSTSRRSSRASCRSSSPWSSCSRPSSCSSSSARY